MLIGRYSYLKKGFQPRNDSKIPRIFSNLRATEKMYKTPIFLRVKLIIEKSVTKGNRTVRLRLVINEDVILEVFLGLVRGIK